MSSPAGAAPAIATPSPALGALVQLTKPGVTRMVVATTFIGAAAVPGPLGDWATVAFALLGTALVVGAANALNMVLEADVDALMERTRDRPIPSGRLSPEAGLATGVALAAVGLAVLAARVNWTTAALGALALAVYVLAYTPLKRVTPFAVWVGAVPGAVPPLLGWTSVTGEIGAAGLSLFLLLLVWQIPHFHAIAIFRSADYERAGLRVLPVVHGLEHTKLSIAVLLVLQLFASALPAFLGLGGVPYLAVATVLGAGYLAWGLAGLRRGAGARWARTLFFLSMPYLLGVLGALAALG